MIVTYDVDIYINISVKRKKKCFSCSDVHFIYKTRKSCDFTFLALPFHKTSHYLLALYPNCLFFFICFMALKGYFLRQISVVNYRLPLIEFEIFIYLLCFHMKQTRKMKIAELQYPKSI